MSYLLEETYLSDTVIVLLEEKLIRRALFLYRCGFKDISAAQMAALAEHIRRAATLPKAREGVAEFIAHQMAKLKRKQDRGGQATSWRLPASSGGSGLTLGDLAIDWITKDRYLDGVEEDLLKLLDKLKTLQRFWSRLHGIYRYGAEFDAVSHGSGAQLGA